MKKILFIAIMSSLLFACAPTRQEVVKQINLESLEIINLAFTYQKMDLPNYLINEDSIRDVYIKISNDSAELGLKYANHIDSLIPKLKAIDYYRKDSSDNLEKIKKEKEFESTKAGMLHKKHPEWSKYDCIKICNNDIWLGMSIEMLKHMNGKPTRANPSNYGNGTRWQWCWDNITPSCYYGGSDGIITSYN